jgi:hypothetical protein
MFLKKVIPAVILLSLAAGCGQQIPAAENIRAVPPVQGTAQQAWRTYEDKQHGLELEYPGNWMIQSIPNQGVMFYKQSTFPEKEDADRNDFVASNTNRFTVSILPLSLQSAESYGKEIRANSTLSVAGEKAIREIDASRPYFESESVRLVHNQQLVTFQQQWTLEGDVDLGAAQLESKEQTFEVLNAILSSVRLTK